MPKFIVATESGCDLSLEFCQQREIYALKMKYTMDGEIQTDTMRPEDLKVFYRKMAEGSSVHTSAANMSDYLDFWTPLLDKKLPIVHVAMGTGISSSYQNALLAREQLLSEHPDAVIYVVDSIGASLSYGMLALDAARMRDEGATPEECVAWLENQRHHANPYYTTGDLEYLYRGGRVSRTGLVIARALNIWPILNLNDKGELKVIEKSRGRKKTYDRITEIIKEDAVDPASQTLYISHADALEEATRFAEQIKSEVGFKDIFYSTIGATIGAHTGPGLVAAFYYGHDRKPSK